MILTQVSSLLEAATPLRQAAGSALSVGESLIPVQTPHSSGFVASWELTGTLF